MHSLPVDWCSLEGFSVSEDGADLSAIAEFPNDIHEESQQNASIYGQNNAQSINGNESDNDFESPNSIWSKVYTGDQSFPQTF